MLIFADTHVHFYPKYKLEKWLESAFNNLNRHINAVGNTQCSAKVLFLTEREDCSFFSYLSVHNNFLDYEFQKIDSLVIKITRGHDSLFIVSGKQVITAEKLEVLVLLTDQKILDGENIEDFLKSDVVKNTILILPWSPGKWLFSRGGFITKIICEMSGNNIFLGDIASRPKYWPESLQFQLARRLNINILAGSDPLPIEDEEKLVGSYISVLETTEKNIDAITLKSAFNNIHSNIGKRLNILNVIFRLYKNNQVKKLRAD